MVSSHHNIIQAEINDFIRDLNLSQTDSELLASRLQDWNLCEKSVKIRSLRI